MGPNSRDGKGIEGTAPNKHDCASSQAVVTPWASATASRISDSGV